MAAKCSNGIVNYYNVVSIINVTNKSIVFKKLHTKGLTCAENESYFYLVTEVCYVTVCTNRVIEFCTCMYLFSALLDTIGPTFL